MSNHSIEEHPNFYFGKIKVSIDALDHGSIIRFIKFIEECLNEDKNFFIAGNGGSASTSSHMACDLGKTILGKNPKENKRRLRTISLNENMAMITAWGNDDSYDVIFSEQLKNLAKNGDFLVVITGSGNSGNILKLVETAKEIGVKTFGLLGFDGGKVKDMLDDYILVSSFDYGVVEDIHLIINHLATDWFKINCSSDK